MDLSPLKLLHVATPDSGLNVLFLVLTQEDNISADVVSLAKGALPPGEGLVHHVPERVAFGM